MQGCVYSCIKYFNPLVLMSKKLITQSIKGGFLFVWFWKKMNKYSKLDQSRSKNNLLNE